MIDPKFMERISQDAANMSRTCYEYAAEARERANSQTPEIKQSYLSVEQSWMRLAESLRFVESVDRFLVDALRHRVSIKPLSPLKANNSHITPIMCEKCDGTAHLVDCIPCTITNGVRGNSMKMHAAEISDRRSETDSDRIAGARLLIHTHQDPMRDRSALLPFAWALHS